MEPFVVVGMPRTGSTLLLTGLTQHPEIMAFGELFHAVASERANTHAFTRAGRKIYFDEKHDDAVAFLKREVFPAAKRGSKAVGFKLFAEMVKCPGTEKLFARLKTEFPDLRVIHIVRRNFFEVLASREVARATKNWVQLMGQKPPAAPQRVRIDPQRTEAFFANMQKVDHFFSSFFAGENYLQVDYTALASDFTGEMSRVYQFLGVSPFEPKKQIEKQISAPLSEVVENYGELRKAFANSPYRTFFARKSVPLTFPRPNELRIGDYVFDLDASPAVKNKFSAEKHFVTMKSRGLIEEFKRVFDDIQPAHLFELGIRRGGSMALFNLAFSPEVHVAIDIEKEAIKALDNVAQRAEKDGRRMRPYFGVDQGDKQKLLSIVKKEFGDSERPLDLVIDDASHLLDPSTASFEVLFPLLREGGIYAVEDWGWAHWDQFQRPDAYFAGQPALTNLIFQLIILHTCRRTIIKKITVTPVVVFVERGPEQLDPLEFRIAGNLVMRGKQLPRIL